MGGALTLAMEFKICKNLDECRSLWNRFSNDSRLFDNWEFRNCFYDPEDNELYFIVGYESGTPVGIIPLCFSKSSSQYNYFGGWFPERNSFFIKDKAKLPEFIAQCPANTFMEGIDPEESRYFNFLEDECTYFLDLEKYDYSFDKYFSSFDKKKQKNLKADLGKIPAYRVHYNRIRDFDRLIELNIKQYGEYSRFNNPFIKKGISEMVKLAHKKGILKMISVEINGNVEAVDAAVLFGEWYHTLIGGVNTQRVPNLGKLMIVLDIKNAIAKKARFVDFFATSGYWKELWDFEKLMLFKFLK